MTLIFPLMILWMAAPDVPAGPDWAAEERWLNDFLGPSETTPDGRTVNASAEYWTGIVGVPFDRDVTLHIPPTPLDLNLDRKVDLVFSTDLELKGGLLAHPSIVGFQRTPNDPRGTVGAYSISTGYLGVREEMNPETKKGTGRYGFNCWYCHATVDSDGAVLYGRPNTAIHLGLILASSRALDESWLIRRNEADKPLTETELRAAESLDGSFVFDENGDHAVSIAEWRRAMKLPPARVTQSLMLLAGPGRLDQSVDARMDGFIPLANLQHYFHDKRGAANYIAGAKSPKYTVFNPVSIPASLTGLGVSHYSWMGKDSSMKVDAVAEMTRHMSITPEQLADVLGLKHDGPVDRELLNREITLDFRNVGTAGRETDSVDGDHWPEVALHSKNTAILRNVPGKYGEDHLRRYLTRHDWPARVSEDDPLVQEGRRIFCEKEVGRILNQRVTFGRESRVPVNSRTQTALVPLDRTKPLSVTVPVRCATCHNHTPGVLLKAMPSKIDGVLRCDNCHMDHPDTDKKSGFIPLCEQMKREKIESIEGCATCHEKHPEFGPLVYSNSWLLPFDADGDGLTQGDEADDLRAGGIGTEAYLQLDSIFVQQLLPPERRRFKDTYVECDDWRRSPATLHYSHEGFGFVRVAPLITPSKTAPFLHNGSVPTLSSLLVPADARPKKFSVGNPAQEFELDTTLPGNGNMGHEFGVDLSDHEKRALVRFLESLP